MRNGSTACSCSPCFRENVVVTCKIESFLCSLDNLLQKNVIVFFFGNQISKWRSFEKRPFLTYFSHFLVSMEKFLQHMSHSHTYMYFAHPIDFFLPYQVWKKKIIYQVLFLFGVIPGIIPICAILEQSINNKMFSKT